MVFIVTNVLETSPKLTRLPHCAAKGGPSGEMAFMDKTELCAFHFQAYSGAKTGCQRGAKCKYAHDLQDLRLLQGKQRQRGLHARILWEDETPPPGHDWVAELRPVVGSAPAPRGLKRPAQSAVLRTLMDDDADKQELRADAREAPPSLVWSGHHINLYLGGVSAVRVGGMLSDCDMVVDCMGYEKQRCWDAAALFMKRPEVLQFPWNYAAARHEHLAKLCDALTTLNTDAAVRTVLFFCKMGERRSAAVLACALCVSFDFHPAAAKAQIEARRPSAKVGEVPQSRHDAAYPIVVQLVHRFNERQARWSSFSSSST